MQFFLISNSFLEPENQSAFCNIFLVWMFCVYGQLCFSPNIQCLYLHFDYGFSCIFFKISWTLFVMWWVEWKKQGYRDRNPSFTSGNLPKNCSLLKITSILRRQKAFFQNFSQPRKMIYRNYFMWVLLTLFCYFLLIVSYIVWKLLFWKLHFSLKLVERHNQVFSSGICNSAHSVFCIMTSSKFKPSQIGAHYISTEKFRKWQKLELTKNLEKI